MRRLTPDEEEELSRVFASLPDDEQIRLLEEGWKMVDANAVCLVCRRRFKGKMGLAIHQGKAGHFGASFKLLDYFIARMLKIVEEED